jgi:hypothetical protein
MWVKFYKPSKRQVQRAAKRAGYDVIGSGKTTDGSYVYDLEVASQNPNFATLKLLTADAGAFDASWL